MTRRDGVRGRPSLAAAVALALCCSVQFGATPSPVKVVDSYRSALASLKRPPFVEFTYTHTRSGPSRIVTEEHRVYRTLDGQERNDTVMVNGTPIVPAASRILHRPVWPYDVAQFAPSPDDYDVSLAAPAFVSGRKALALKLARRTAADFTLKDLFFDPRRFLPLRETFSVTGGNCSGDGLINFGPASEYWLPTSIQVTCTAQTPSGPAVYKESIRFSNYAFPNAIPADVFNASASSPDTQATPTQTP